MTAVSFLELVKKLLDMVAKLYYNAKYNVTL